MHSGSSPSLSFSLSDSIQKGATESRAASADVDRGHRAFHLFMFVLCADIMLLISGTRLLETLFLSSASFDDVVAAVQMPVDATMSTIRHVGYRLATGPPPDTHSLHLVSACACLCVCGVKRPASTSSSCPHVPSLPPSLHLVREDHGSSHQLGPRSTVCVFRRQHSSHVMTDDGRRPSRRQSLLNFSNRV